MKRLLSLFVLCCSFGLHAQLTSPAPPGISPYEVLDTDNDGFLPFDMIYYVESIYKPAMAAFGGDLSGYTYAFYKAGMIPVTSPYTNETNPDDLTVAWTYSGTGPIFNPPGSGSPNGGLTFSDFPKLLAVPVDLDYDNDGVLNGDEDPNGNGVVSDDNTDGEGAFDYRDPDDDGDGIPTINEDYNGNGNPLDDDTNNDGIPDFRQASVALSIGDFPQYQLKVYPNPSKGTVYMQLDDWSGSSVIIYDVSGKLIREFANTSGVVEVQGLQAGMYFVKATGKRTFVKKLVVL